MFTDVVEEHTGSSFSGRTVNSSAGKSGRCRELDVWDRGSEPTNGTMENVFLKLASRPSTYIDTKFIIIP
jgi:hypothetical protein